MNELMVGRLRDWFGGEVSGDGRMGRDLVRHFQRKLKADGYDVGEIDGLWGSRTDAAASQYFGFVPGVIHIERVERGGVVDWPDVGEMAMESFYGKPGDNIVVMSLPYRMRIAWDTDVTVERTRVNRRCQEAMQGALEGVLRHYGSLAEVRNARMDLFGGVFNLRRKRGGTQWSTHAYGAAIDLDPAQNGMGVEWPEVATMPIVVVDIFESFGANAGAMWRVADAMHFQFTQ